MNASRVFVLVNVLLFLGLGGTSSLAQSDTALTPGKRVRVTAPSVTSNSVTGKIKEYSTVLVIYREKDTMLVTSSKVRQYDTVLVYQRVKDSILTTFQLDDITKLEVSTGHRSNIALGALIGATVGTAVMVAGRSADSNDGIGEVVWLIAIPGGLLFGTLIGAATSGERWETVDLNRLQMGFAPIGRDLVGIRLSFTF